MSASSGWLRRMGTADTGDTVSATREADPRYYVGMKGDQA